MEKIKNFFASKSYSWVVWVVAEIIILAIVFALGVRVGLHKAKYSFDWGKNYERNFMGHREERMGPGMLPPMGPGGPTDFFGDRGNDFRNAHGIAGEIISIVDNTIIIKDRDNKENTISVSDKTIIKSGRDDVKITDLKNDERIVVLGKPDSSGVINAELIRVFSGNDLPAPPFAGDNNFNNSLPNNPGNGNNVQ